MSSYSTCKVTVKNLAFERIWQQNTTLFGLILSNSPLSTVGGCAGCVKPTVPPMSYVSKEAKWGKSCIHDRIVFWRPILKEPHLLYIFRN